MNSSVSTECTVKKSENSSNIKRNSGKTLNGRRNSGSKKKEKVSVPLELHVTY